MNTLEQEVRRELTENILPFWMNAMPDGAGGFIGRIDGTGRHCPDAERGAILNARILWTFAAAWRMFKVEKYRETAETVVGCLNQYRLSGDTVWKTRALAEWNFIRRNIICPEGEWFWGAIPDGDGFRPDTANDRAGFWKCPYHNGRMCMELQQLADGIHV